MNDIDYLKQNRRYYQQCVDNSLADINDDRSVYNRLLFALLSVNTNLKNHLSAYQEMKDIYWYDKQKTADMLLKHGIQYSLSRGGYIAENTQKFLDGKLELRRKQGETWVDYRARLVKEVKGLGNIKVSFFITLIYRDADLVCLDTHMIASLGYHGPTEMKRLKSAKLYRQYESKFLDLSQKVGISAFAVQWGLWDKWRNSRCEMQKSFE